MERTNRFFLWKCIKGWSLLFCSCNRDTLSQIERKSYDGEMRDRGIEKITKVGMVFSGKKIKLYVSK